MSDKYTPAIVDALDGVDFWRSDVAGLLELMDAGDPRAHHINNALFSLRECRSDLAMAIDQENQS